MREERDISEIRPEGKPLKSDKEKLSAEELMDIINDVAKEVTA